MWLCPRRRRGPSRRHNSPSEARRMTRRSFVLVVALVVSSLTIQAGSAPIRAKRGMVVSQSAIAF